ncbi:MAG: methyltransferase domain-containing protein [Crocinitomicaceae bacterium]|nr:methyltransferase domain-containing protein [Crocinitomicaceae bacterium]
MISEKEFLKAELEMGIDPFNEGFINLCNATADAIINEVKFETILDYGAGVGAYSDAFYKKGYNVVSYEYFKEHREYMAEKLPHLTIVQKPITTDLMLFIEVAEHMTDRQILFLFKKIKPTYILFSSTPNTTDWDADWGHINIKTSEQWISMFDKLGYEFIKEMPFPTTWSKLFKLK